MILAPILRKVHRQSRARSDEASLQRGSRRRPPIDRRRDQRFPSFRRNRSRVRSASRAHHPADARPTGNGEREERNEADRARPSMSSYIKVKNQLPKLDAGLSALLQDLAERGLDRDVTVVMWGEFGRTP